MPEWTIRAGGVVRKEITEILRQPQLVGTLIVGPFLILLLFGTGLGDLALPVRTVVLLPTDSEFEQLAEGFSEPPGSRVRLEGITTDREEALDRLRAGDLDLVVEVPPDAEERFAADEQATVTLYHNYIDPLENNALILTVGRTVGAVNDQVLRGLVAQGQQDTEDAAQQVEQARRSAALLREAIERGDRAAGDEQRRELERAVTAADDALADAAVAPLRIRGLVDEEGTARSPADTLDAAAERLAAFSPDDEDALRELRALESELARTSVALDRFRSLSAETIVSPFRGRAERIGEQQIGLSDFYAPAVVALLLQHMVLTMVALSVVRDQQLGTDELFRVAPLSPLELLVGRYAAALAVGGAVAVAVIGLLILGLGVPMAGSWPVLAVATVLLVAASCGLGLLLALLARSDTQAVQYAMMVLLASLFLCGFVLTLDYFRPPIQALARFLPATLAIEVFRGLMLRGTSPPGPLLGLAAMALVLFAANAVALTRRTRAR